MSFAEAHKLNRRTVSATFDVSSHGNRSMMFALSAFSAHSQPERNKSVAEGRKVASIARRSLAQALFKTPLLSRTSPAWKRVAAEVSRMSYTWPR